MSIKRRLGRLTVLFAAAAACLAAVAGSAIASPGALKILIAEAQCDESLPSFNLQTSIAAQPGVASVEFFDSNASTPTAQQLAGYDAVVAMGDCSWSDPVAFGDALADFQDQGGAAIGATFSWQSGSDFAGRWMTGGYTPFALGAPSAFNTVMLGSADTAHPLMQGVNSLQAYYVDAVALTPGATQLAAWNTGPIAVAVKGNALGINANLGNNYPEPVLGDFGRLIVNAANQLGKHTINVAKSGTGSGTITASVGGIDCGAICSATIINGTTVSFRARPKSGQIFTGWSGGQCSGVIECSYVPSSNDTVVGSFVKNPLTFGKASGRAGSGVVTLKVKFAAAGKVKISGKGITSTTKRIKQAGTVKIKLKLNSAGKMKLAANGSLKVKTKFKYTATGNGPVTKSKSIKFK